MTDISMVMTGNGPRRVRNTGHEAGNADFSRIPVIDFAPMLGNDASGKTKVSAALRDACVNVGFFYLVNHGIPETVRSRAFAATRRFFEQPLAAKVAIHVDKSAHLRGYTPTLSENFDTANGQGDLKEAFDLALDVPIDHPALLPGQSLYGPNVWPDHAPDFRRDIQAYFDAMLGLGRCLFQAFALALDLPPDNFDSMLDLPLATMRLNHYPPQPSAPPNGQIGAGAHSDYECFTILAQDDVGGLQVLNGAGDWIAAPPIPGAFVINIADMMARWTNDLFVSTVHRVVNASGQERYSIPFFFGPSYDVVVEPLPSCVSAAQPAAYPPILAGKYLEGRLAVTVNHLMAPA